VRDLGRDIVLVSTVDLVEEATIHSPTRSGDVEHLVGYVRAVSAELIG
jgi:hypothetical protein